MAELHSVVLTRLPPFPPTAGVPLRVAGNIKALAQLGPVDLVTVGPERSSDQPPFVRSVHQFRRGAGGRVAAISGWWRRSGLALHPFAAELHLAPVLEQVSQLLAGSPRSLVLLEEAWFAPYLDDLRGLGPAIVYSAHNVEALLRAEITGAHQVGALRRVRRRLIVRRVIDLERRMVSGADQVWACSGADAEHLHRLYGRSSGVHVIPNAVDTAAFAPVRRSRESTAAPARNVTYVGDLGYQPNDDAARWLATSIMPLVWEHDDEVALHLVGRGPSADLVELSSRDPRIVVTGEVADLTPWLARAGVMGVALRLGSGTRLKLLEAFAAGVPVVSTTKGAEGLDVTDGAELLLADDARSLAAALLRVWDDPDRARSRAAAALALVERDYDHASIARLVARALTS